MHTVGLQPVGADGTSVPSSPASSSVQAPSDLDGLARSFTGSTTAIKGSPTASDISARSFLTTSAGAAQESEAVNGSATHGSNPGEHGLTSGLDEQHAGTLHIQHIQMQKQMSQAEGSAVLAVQSLPQSPKPAYSMEEIGEGTDMFAGLNMDM